MAVARESPISSLTSFIISERGGTPWGSHRTLPMDLLSLMTYLLPLCADVNRHSLVRVSWGFQSYSDSRQRCSVQRKLLDDSAMSWSCCDLHYFRFFPCCGKWGGRVHFAIPGYSPSRWGSQSRHQKHRVHSQEPRKDCFMDPSSCVCFLLGLSWFFLFSHNPGPSLWDGATNFHAGSSHLISNLHNPQGHAHRAAWSRQFLIETSRVILCLIKLTGETAKLRDSQFAPDYDRVPACYICCHPESHPLTWVA